jgi:hypothetical protein
LGKEGTSVLSFFIYSLNNHMENFQGQDGFVWFTGVVEDRNDPTKLGRVRVRCVGYHTDNKTKIPTEDLPWAWVMQNVHTPSMSGWGDTPGFMVEGTWVVGFFRDAESLQEPIIIGTLPGVPNQAGNPNFGFHDPRRRDEDPNKPGYNISKYPPTPLSSSDHSINESDMNRLARNESGYSHKMLDTKNKHQAGYINIPVAGGTPFAEPVSAYQAEYPFNHVMESESGHIKEYDDTEENERIHEYHRAGTFYEIDGGGNRTVKIVGDGYHIVAGSDHLFVGGNCNITVESNCNMYVKKDWNIQVDGDMNLLVQGNKTEQVMCGGTIEGFSKEIVKNGFKTTSVDHTVTNIYGEKFNEHIKSDITRNYATKVEEFIGTTHEQNITESSTIRIGTTYDLDSGTDITIDGTTINMNQGTKGAARLDDQVDTGDDPAGISGSDGSNKIEAASNSVKIGTDAGSMTEPTEFTESDLLEIDLDPVETVRSAYGLDNLNMDAVTARAISDGREVEVANGIDPDTNEGIEYGDGGVGGSSPVTGETGAVQTGATLNQETYSGGSEFEPYTKEFGYNLEDKLRFLSHTDPRISPTLGQILENLSDSYGQKLTITSAYRSPAYNKKVGGAKKSVHQQGLACDVVMSNTTKDQRLDFISKAGAAGIKGIGLYFSSGGGANFIHCDLGGTRQWGPSGSRKSQYGWAKPTLKAAGWFV